MNQAPRYAQWQRGHYYNNHAKPHSGTFIPGMAPVTSLGRLKQSPYYGTVPTYYPGPGYTTHYSTALQPTFPPQHPSSSLQQAPLPSINNTQTSKPKLKPFYTLIRLLYGPLLEEDKHDLAAPEVCIELQDLHKYTASESMQDLAFEMLQKQLQYEPQFARKSLHIQYLEPDCLWASYDKLEYAPETSVQATIQRVLRREWPYYYFDSSLLVEDRYREKLEKLVDQLRSERQNLNMVSRSSADSGQSTPGVMEQNIPLQQSPNSTDNSLREVQASPRSGPETPESDQLNLRDGDDNSLEQDMQVDIIDTHSIHEKESETRLMAVQPRPRDFPLATDNDASQSGPVIASEQPRTKSQKKVEEELDKFGSHLEAPASP